MHLSSVSAATAAGKTTSAASGGDEPAQGFDTMLAALLPTPDLVAEVSADIVSPADGPAAATQAPATVPTDAVAALLASLPGPRDPALPAADGEPPAEARSIAAPVSGSPDTSGLLPQAGDRAASKAGTEWPDRLQKTATARAMHENAGDRLLRPISDHVPDRLPLVDGAPAQPRNPERDAGPPTLPAIFSAEQRPGLATTELPARQAVLPVAPALSSPAWNRAFSEQVLWVARADVQSASLTLNPPELGPVTIELQLADTQATASFSSAQPEVRKAIDDALPMLKTLFAEAGLDLRHTDVGSGEAQQRHGREAHPASGRRSGAAADAGLPEAAALPMMRTSRGLLDTFA